MPALGKAVSRVVTSAHDAASDREVSEAVPASGGEPGGQRRPVLGHRSPVLLAILVSVIALLPRLLTAGGDFITTDEPRWMINVEGFSDALAEASPANASATRYAEGVETMPGVTTMWVGTGARLLWNAGHGLGLLDEEDAASRSFATSTSALNLAQGLMGLVTAAAIGALVVLVAAWVGRPAALFTGLLLATEPFWVGHGALILTDELYALFGVASFVAAALFLGLPDTTRWRGRRSMAACAGLLFAASWLTKASALTFLPSVALLGLWAARKHGLRLERSTVSALTGTLRSASWAITAGVATVLVAYPALWANPIGETFEVGKSLAQGTQGHGQFFLGSFTMTPGPLYYLVALPLRMTPWFLVGTLAAVAALCTVQSLRRYALAVACLFGPPFLLLSFSSKQFDRYGLPLLAAIAIAIGIGTQHGYRWLCHRVKLRQQARVGLLAGITGALLVHAVVISPWGLAYYNPALGGSSTARDALLIGWGEGTERAVDIIDESGPHGCDDDPLIHLASVHRRHLDFWSCGTYSAEPSDESYVILYVSHIQRMSADDIQRRVAERELLGVVEIRGLTHAEVYGPRASR